MHKSSDSAGKGWANSYCRFLKQKWHNSTKKEKIIVGQGSWTWCREVRLLIFNLNNKTLSFCSLRLRHATFQQLQIINPNVISQILANISSSLQDTNGCHTIIKQSTMNFFAILFKEKGYYIARYDQINRILKISIGDLMDWKKNIQVAPKSLKCYTPSINLFEGKNNEQTLQPK